MTEIPAYQAIDLILGRHAKVTKQPLAGWAVSCPTNGTTLIEGDYAEALEKAKAASRYPNAVVVFPAWIHEQETIYGEVSNRRHWTPR